MKMYQNKSFSRQLILYLLIVLIITFILITITLANSVNQFIGSNAYNQAQSFSSNVKKSLKKEILRMESLPDKFIGHTGSLLHNNPDHLPELLLKEDPQLLACSVCYNIDIGQSHLSPTISAYRDKNGIIFQHKLNENKYNSIHTHPFIRKNHQGAFWIYSTLGEIQTISYCCPLLNRNFERFGYLKLDFPLSALTDPICQQHRSNYSYLFIIDSNGRKLASRIRENEKEDFHTMQIFDSSNLKGESSSSTCYINNIKYFTFYSSLPCMPWRLGLVCPYDQILNSSHKLYWVIFLCLGGGLLVLFIGTVNIVHRLSYPLKQLAYTTRQIAEGRFNTEIPEVSSTTEIKELYDSFRYMQQSLINYIEKLKISTAEKEQRKSEMKLARRIQQRFLPTPIELPANIDFAAELRQSQEVGGDLYEFFMISNLLYFVIGDVSGKGTPAALYMVSICKLFRYVASNHTSTATICNIINKHMCEDTEDDMYVTMFMGIIDINTGIMTYTNAGHPYPVVLHDNGETHFLSKYPDVPIGILENHSFAEHIYTLRKNTSLLFYTDGITDAENQTGKFYGKNRLLGCLHNHASDSPKEIIEKILEDIQQHIGERRQSDDLTLLMLRFKGIP